MIADIRYRIKVSKPLEYMVLREIKRGEIVAAHPLLGGVVPSGPNSIPLGIAKRDLKPGEIIKVLLGKETEDVRAGGGEGE